MRQGGPRIRAQHTLGDKEDSGAQASNAMEGLGATFCETLDIDVDIAEIRNLRLRWPSAAIRVVDTKLVLCSTLIQEIPVNFETGAKSRTMNAGAKGRVIFFQVVISMFRQDHL